MKRFVLIACLLALAPPVGAQSSGPIPAVAVEQPQRVLPANTPVPLVLNETLSTKSKHSKKGETFTLSVRRNVTLGGYIVIPRGSRAIGHVTYRTKKGAFGKSGKIEIALDYIELGDRRIAIEGRRREEGEGNTTATVATAFFSILGASFITGHSAEIERGQEITAWTKDDVPVQFLPVGVPSVALAGNPLPTLPANPEAIPAQPIAQPQVPTLPHAPALMGNAHVICETCR